MKRVCADPLASFSIASARPPLPTTRIRRLKIWRSEKCENIVRVAPRQISQAAPAFNAQ